jgi:hypothetical protein
MTDERRWLACAPLYIFRYSGEPIVDPVVLGEGVLLSALPAWSKSRDVLQVLSPARRDDFVSAKYALQVPYEAAFLGETAPGEGRLKTYHERAEQQLFLASLAMWLAKPTSTYVDFLAHFQGTEERAVLRQWGSLDGIKAHLTDRAASLTVDDLARAAALHRAVGRLDREAPVWIAIRLLWKSLTDTMWEVRVLLQWVALEALFGPENPGGEISYRLALRVACFLQTGHDSRTALFRRVKANYSWRSRIVHGSRLGKLTEKESAEVSHDLEQVVREAIVAILSSSTATAVFEGKGRESHLDSLVLGNGLASGG